MVRARSDNNWMRQGCSLLWSTHLLLKVAKPTSVVSLRQFFALAKAWPEELPSSDGNALVVSGLEGCLDILDTPDAERWVERDLKELILSFQGKYEGQAALIFWVPSGSSRISMVGSSEEYYWKHGISRIHLGRLLWSGAENEVERLLDTNDKDTDFDGKAWAGLYHPRIS